tara:strand:- start:32 stop:1351 length:1320 start_codon:yes stop_codon:yes gene_type:complete
MESREQWRSGLGFILAAAGSAVGLGNLWGFAYKASQGGGLAFLLLYVLIVLVVCLPVLVAEMVLGRSTGKSPLMAPIDIAGQRWQPMGWIFVIASCGILSFYAVLMGWTIDTFFHSFFFGLPQTLDQANSFISSVSTGSSVFLGQLLSLVLTASVVAAGIRGGIERIARWSMPLLFGLVIILAIWASTLPGAFAGYQEFLFKLDLSQFSNLKTIRLAFGQAFFSLSLGIGIMIAYSSYLDKKKQLPKQALLISGLDTTVGILAGMVTFPIVMSFAAAKEAHGASFVKTLFVALPTGLSSLGLTGQFIAVLFFALAFIAALTSSISLLEVPVASLMDYLGWNRNKSVIVSTSIIFLIGIPAALSDKVLENMAGFFDLLLLLGGLLISILIGWFVTGTYDKDLAESNSSNGARRYLKFMLRWISPPAIALGLYISIKDLYF